MNHIGDFFTFGGQMNILKNILHFLWRLWFYILILFAILLLFPFLVIIAGSERLYRRFFIVARIWAKIVLFGMGFFPKIKRLEKMKPGKPYMIVSNHSSMIDIMLMFHVIRQPFVFVGKKELAKFPIFGFFYRKTCILVDRKNVKSRSEVFTQAHQKLKQGVGICIFPEGGVPDDETVLLDNFKDGAFRLAAEHNLTIVPIVIYNSKKRYPYTFYKGSPGTLHVKTLPFIQPKGNNPEIRRNLREQTRELILEELKKNPTKTKAIDQFPKGNY